MYQKLKNALKCFFPPPAAVFNREMERVLAKLDESQRSYERKLDESQRSYERKLDESQRSYERKLESIACDLENRMSRRTEDVRRYASEAVWAEIFNDTIVGAPWIEDTAFSPGRWAVGYPYLYAMFRVLQEAHPRSILELGLGQSTKMLAQYAANNGDVRHYVVEHDQDWIEFFQRSVSELPENSSVVRLDLMMAPYKEADEVRVYDGFQERFQGKQFDFISIDAPLGGDMKQYARIDLLSILPQCLGENFVVMIDDTERSGEKNTIREIEQCLAEHNIEYQKGCYNGKKDCTLICAKHLGFLCSM